MNNDEFYKLVNKWRIIPRSMILMYGYIFYEVTQWFMHLVAPNSQQAAFVSVIVGASAAFFGLYVNSGNKTDE